MSFLPPVRGIVAGRVERATTGTDLAGVDGATRGAAEGEGGDVLGREKASSPTLVTTLVANERAVVGEWSGPGAERSRSWLCAPDQTRRR